MAGKKLVILPKYLKAQVPYCAKIEFLPIGLLLDRPNVSGTKICADIN
jgi:hypothetical protein